MSCAYSKYLDKETKGKRPEMRRKRVDKYSFDWLNSGKTLSINELPEKIIVLGDDGIGDEIFYVQFLLALARKCKEVVWVCNWKDEHKDQDNDNSKLIPLFQNSFHTLENVKFWHFCETGTLPLYKVIFSKELIRYFGCPQDQCKSVKYPYLSASQPFISKLTQRYKNGNKKIVGLAWHSEGGKPEKSLPFKDHPEWKDIFEQKDNHSFISLQYGDVSDSINYVRYKYGVEIYHDAEIDHINNLEAAAAQVAACDIIISISTTAAHLAGAMSKPTLLLLPKDPIVHWKFDCAYPTVKRIDDFDLCEAAKELKKIS